jgi:predicted peptidase
MLDGRDDFPFVVVSPQLGLEWTEWPTAMLSALLDSVEETVRVDRDRIYVTGLSRGGAGTWALAIAEPDRFAAIAPVAGYSDPRQAARISRVPAWVFHGARDIIVPPAASQAMVDALRAAGGEVRFSLIPDFGHDGWKRIYDDPALYDWFLAHRRGQ